jgi:hypothetical protein
MSRLDDHAGWEREQAATLLRLTKIQAACLRIEQGATFEHAVRVLPQEPRERRMGDRSRTDRRMAKYERVREERRGAFMRVRPEWRAWIHRGPGA